MNDHENLASPVSGDQPAVSSRVSSQAHVELTKTIAETAGIPQWQAAQAASFLLDEEGWRPPQPDSEGQSPWDAYIAAYRDYQETDPHGAEAHPTAHHMHALEAALRVAGSRRSQPAPLAVHFAGPYVTVGGRRRQLCAWCGHVLLDVHLAPGQEHEPWFDVKLVRVEDGTTTRQPYTYGDPLPTGCCALPDDEPVDDGLCEKCPAPAVDEPFGLRLCRQHLTEHIDAETDAEYAQDAEECHRTPEQCAALGCNDTCTADGPDEAQETRAADWPAEERDHG